MKLNKSLSNYLIKQTEKKLKKHLERATKDDNRFYHVKKYEHRYHQLLIEQANKQTNEEETNDLPVLSETDQ